MDQVWDPESYESYDVFPRLYLDASLLSPAPYLSLTSPRKTTASFVITHSVWRFRSTVVLVSLSDGSVKSLTPVDGDADNRKLYSWTVSGTGRGDESFACGLRLPLVYLSRWFWESCPKMAGVNSVCDGQSSTKRSSMILVSSFTATSGNDDADFSSISREGSG